MNNMNNDGITQNDPGFNGQVKDKETQVNIGNVNYYCRVCFNAYDGTQQRPRVLPCGHSYCFDCIQCNLIEEKIICPTCRKVHLAKKATDFPINYDMVNYYQSSTNTIHDSEPNIASSDKPPISKWLENSRTKHCKDMKELEAAIQRTNSDLYMYKTKMNMWKDIHQSEMEFHMAWAQKHQEVVTCFNKENQTLEDSSGQVEKILQEVRNSVDDLNATNTSKELFSLMEKSSNIYNAAHGCNLDIKKAYPNSRLIIRSQKLREESKSLLGKLRSRLSNDEDKCLQNTAISAAVDESAAEGKECDKVEEELFSIQEKMDNLLANLESLQMNQITQIDDNAHVKTDQIVQTHESSLFNASDLKALTPFAKMLIESKRVFAVQQVEGETRYAIITLDQNGHICIHTLCKNITLPVNAIFVQHRDLFGANVRPGLTFFDLTAEGRFLGRLQIRLIPYGKYSLNFHKLCTGETGPSYAHSNALTVIGKNDDYELIRFGDHESKNGLGGKAVIPRVNWKKEKKRRIYSNNEWDVGILGMPHWITCEATASHFNIYTKRRMIENRYGKVEEGLDILREAISQYEMINKVVIKDCGIILDKLLSS